MSEWLPYSDVTFPSNVKGAFADTLKPGDVFLRDGVRVTVLRESEPAPNRFGLNWFRLWCRRGDTEQEGWMTFGPRGIVQILPY